MIELEQVPYEVSHIYALASAAGRFSVFISRSSKSVPDYVKACNLLLGESRTASVHGMRWFHENPNFTAHHAILEECLSTCLRRQGREIQVVGGGEYCIEGPNVLWRQHELEGIFRCGVLLCFDSLPTALAQLLASTSSPHVVQGANEAFKAAMAKAKRMTKEGRFSLLVRPGEVELYGPESALRQAFNMAHKMNH